ASMVLAASPPQASRGDAATRAPARPISSAFSRERLQTVTSCPALMSERAMPLPIWPTPMTPIFISSSPCARADNKRKNGRSEVSAVGAVMILQLAQLILVDLAAHEDHCDRQSAHCQERVHQERCMDTFGQRGGSRDKCRVEAKSNGSAGDLEHVDDPAGETRSRAIERGNRRRRDRRVEQPDPNSEDDHARDEVTIRCPF